MNTQDNNASNESTAPIIGAAIAAASGTPSTESTGAADTATQNLADDLSRATGVPFEVRHDGAADTTGTTDGAADSTTQSTEVPPAAKSKTMELSLPMFALAIVLLVLGVWLAAMGIYALLTFLFGATVGGIITCVLLIGAEWWLIFSRSGFDKLADVYFGFFAKKDPAQQAAAAAHVDASFAAQAPAEAELAAAAGL